MGNGCREGVNILPLPAAKRVRSLYAREFGDRLSKDGYAWLAERGLIKTNEYYDGAWQIVILSNKEIRDKLPAMGERIKEK